MPPIHRQMLGITYTFPHEVFPWGDKEKAGRRKPLTWAGNRLLPATVRMVRGPCFVMRDYAVDDQLLCQVLMPEDVDGRVAYEQRFAVIDVFVGNSGGPLGSLCVVGHGITQAVYAAANVQVVMHCRAPGLCRRNRQLLRHLSTWQFLRLRLMTGGGLKCGQDVP